MVGEYQFTFLPMTYHGKGPRLKIFRFGREDEAALISGPAATLAHTQILLQAEGDPRQEVLRSLFIQFYDPRPKE